MGMIRGAIAKTSSVKGMARGPCRDPDFAGDRTLPATEYRDPATDTGEQSGQELDSARSRGYGRYEI